MGYLKKCWNWILKKFSASRCISLDRSIDASEEEFVPVGTRFIDAEVDEYNYWDDNTCSSTAGEANTQAEGLPEGWIWRDWNDGSGSLNAPDGTRYFVYDLMTGEYDKYANRDWRFWIDYPEFPMNLHEFKNFAENQILKILSGEEQAV